ncbi:collagen alpha-2(I) chain-like [Pyrgilauda ruficollis]|uniref:collagen alpha-2(I) chain-like n=1 Tax=Pyrgilauda ruficollis TaxID=221976 RepID=UPI001B863B21|nr:collagen alpha-2(I) chain-like [Pyrgilauda ruficollis]
MDVPPPCSALGIQGYSGGLGSGDPTGVWGFPEVSGLLWASWGAGANPGALGHFWGVPGWFRRGLGSPGGAPTTSPQDPQGCVRLERVNVSQLLESLAQHLGGLQGRPPHFPGCARLRCHPGPALTSPAVRHEGTLGARRGPPSPAGHGLLLLGAVGGALGLVAVVWALYRRPCAQVGTLGTLQDAGEGMGGTGGAVGDTGSTGGSLGAAGSTGEHWEVAPRSPPQPSQGPPALEQDGT